MNKTKIWINDYLEFIDFKIEEPKTLEYLKIIKNKHAVGYYRKIAYQILGLLKYLKCDWADNIRIPDEPEGQPIRVSYEDINETLEFFKGHKFEKQFKAVIHLGKDSGLRPSEIFQLNPNDIDLDNRTVSVVHNPVIGKTAKNKKSRISLFTSDTRKFLLEYMEYFNNGSNLKKLFSQTHIQRAFADAPIKVGYLRKFFSQEWDRRGGPTSIKKILMGHSIRNDVDLNHYNYQSQEDLKRIYDQVFGDLKIT